MSEVNATCPNCGYCPHCGRSAQPYWFVPYYPYQPTYYPWWQLPQFGNGITWTTGQVSLTNVAQGCKAPYTFTVSNQS